MDIIGAFDCGPRPKAGDDAASQSLTDGTLRGAWRRAPLCSRRARSADRATEGTRKEAGQERCWRQEVGDGGRGQPITEATAHLAGPHNGSSHRFRRPVVTQQPPALRASRSRSARIAPRGLADVHLILSSALMLH